MEAHHLMDQLLQEEQADCCLSAISPVVMRCVCMSVLQRPAYGLASAQSILLPAAGTSHTCWREHGSANGRRKSLRTLQQWPASTSRQVWRHMPRKTASTTSAAQYCSCGVVDGLLLSNEQCQFQAAFPMQVGSGCMAVCRPRRGLRAGLTLTAAAAEMMWMERILWPARRAGHPSHWPGGQTPMAHTLFCCHGMTSSTFRTCGTRARLGPQSCQSQGGQEI